MAKAEPEVIMVREIPWHEILTNEESIIILERCVDAMIEREGYYCDRVRHLPGHECYRDSLHYFNGHWLFWYIDHLGSMHSAKINSLKCGDFTPTQTERMFPCVK